MPITRTDRIGGAIYVIAKNAELAQDLALAHLAADGDESHNVFDDLAPAKDSLHDRFRAHDPEDRVYVVRLEITPAE